MHQRILCAFVFYYIIAQTASQKASPCPRIFSYEPRGTEEDRWYGVVSLQSDRDLDGIWLRVTLDRPAELLGNWFGEAVSDDNVIYTIKNSKYRLEAGPHPVSVRFFVKYNLAQSVPSVKSIRLNGELICDDNQSDEIGSTTPILHISRPRSTTPAPSTDEPFLSSGTRRPSGNSNSGGNLIGHQTGSSNTNTNNNRRPGVNSQSSSNSNNRGNGNNNNNKGGGGSNSGTVSLTAEDTVTHHQGSDFFPGDFAAIRPQTASRPSQPTLQKREISCGTVTAKASPLISYGQSTSPGQWPWHAALFHYSTTGQFMYTCGGTLISDSHVLTAAHCVAKPQTSQPVALEKLVVYLGKHSLKKFGHPVQSREIVEITIHPRYNHSFFYNDIAIVKLDHAVEFDNFVRPCCLWDDSDDDSDDIENKLGTVVGWGFDENRQISDSLMQAQMPVVSTTTCIYSNRDFFSQFTNEQTYCAGFRNGTTVCNGDSGGGMVFPKPGTSGANTVWQIRGLVSVGVALQGQGVCDPSHYIVFTDVAKHLQWINGVLQRRQSNRNRNSNY